MSLLQGITKRAGIAEQEPAIPQIVFNRGSITRSTEGIVFLRVPREIVREGVSEQFPDARVIYTYLPEGTSEPNAQLASIHPNECN